MKKLEEYTKEELVALYKRIPVYATTWWFKYYRTYKMKPCEKEEPIIMRNLDLTDFPSNPVRYYHQTKINLIDYDIRRLSENEKDNFAKIQKLTIQREALRVIDQCLYWFWGGYDLGMAFYYGYEIFVISPEDMMTELHMNDDLNIENGVATDLQVYEYVWNTLQYLNIKQLDKLLKFADKGIENKWKNISMEPGRRSRNSEIRQIDIETGETVNTYTSRNALINKIGIKKSHLSQCIKTSNDNPNNRNVWKKWIGNDERRYGFVEELK